MLVSFLLNSIKNLLIFVIGFIEVESAKLVGSAQFVSMIKTSSYFFPSDVFISFIAMMGVTLTISFVWACVEWVYQKIPGVN